jgi:arginyl-tRNA synthetase
MQTLLQVLQNLLTKAIKKSLDEKIMADVAPCDEKFGHYQCNSALKLSKIVKKNPRDTTGWSEPPVTVLVK